MSLSDYSPFSARIIGAIPGIGCIEIVEEDSHILLAEVRESKIAVVEVVAGFEMR